MGMGPVYQTLLPTGFSEWELPHHTTQNRLLYSRLMTLHVISISVICSCSSSLLHWFLFVLSSVVDSRKFVLILLFVFFIFFFLDKSL